MRDLLLGVYGASGCGRGVMPLLVQQMSHTDPNRLELVFVDDKPQADMVNGRPVVTFEDFCQRPAKQRVACLAIAAGKVRSVLAQRLRNSGIGTLSARASNIVIMDDVEIGEGEILSPFVTITSNVRIGRFFHANLYSYVEHDCVIGDFVTFAPGAKCNGNVHVEDYAYIGSGAVIKQGRPGQPLRIGRGAVVGMGAVVTRDVPPGTTVVGNPARPIPAKG